MATIDSSPSPLLFRRGEATSAVGLRHCSQDAPPIYREDTFPAARAFRLSTARGKETELSLREIEAKIGRQLIAGASSLRAKTFFR